VGDKPLSTLISKLCKQLSDSGLTSLAKILFKSIGDRSLSEHRKWDEETRGKTKEHTIQCLTDSIHTLPKEGIEVPPDDLKKIICLPPLDIGSMPEDIKCDEVKALEIMGYLRIENKHILIPNPGRMIGAVVDFIRDEPLLRIYESYINAVGLFDNYISPVRKRLNAFAEREWLMALSASAKHIYNLAVESVSAERIYTGTPDFIQNAGAGTAVTFATSTGIFDPLEHFGTEELVKLMGIEEGDEYYEKINEKIKKKSAWRIVNFRDGILNSKFEARRLYFFDREATSKSMNETLSILTKEQRATYKEIAAGLLSKALDCPRFELFEVDRFYPWMWRYTRSSPGHALISLRHPETKALSEGIEFNFNNAKDLASWFQRIFRISTKVLMLVPNHPFQLTVIVAALLEGELANQVKKEFMRVDVENDARKNSKRVVLKGKTKNAKKMAARDYIESIL
jgi:hypothetical protein